MARTYGKPADYLLEKASDKTLQMLLGALVLAAVLGIGIGLAIMQQKFGRLSAEVVVATALTFLLVHWLKRRLLAWEDDHQRFRRGARGEVVVAHILSKLSDRYFVMHNVPTPYADYDHLVIGPAGIFAIETKDWRGLVSPDGLGELLLNGTPLAKPVVRHFIAHVMRLRNHVCETTGREHFFQPVFVFTSALLKAKPGDTRNAHCLPEEKLLEYIEQAKPAQRLSRADILQITKSLYAFAQMNGKPPHIPDAEKTPAADCPTVAPA